MAKNTSPSKFGNYDPALPLMRQMLALSIVNTLEDSGFKEVTPKKRQSRFGTRPMTWQQERVYERYLNKEKNLKVVVYTTVIGGDQHLPLSVRYRAKDAIRVCGLYKTTGGKVVGVTKEKRINRVGNIEDIIDRMLNRMRNAWSSLKNGDCCRYCGAPCFISKKGNVVCAEICWKSGDKKRINKKDWRKEWK